MRTLEAILSASLVATIPLHAATASTPQLLELTETAMEAQFFDAILLTYLFGVDPSADVGFALDIDPLGGTFGYQTAAGSSYQGQPLAITSTGNGDFGTGEYSWTTDYALGADSWQGNGMLSWTATPLLLAGGNGDEDKNGAGMATVVLGGNEYKITITALTYTESVTQTISQGSYQITGPMPGSGVETTWNASGTDRILPNGEWIHNVRVPQHPFVPEGVIRIQFAGAFDDPANFIGGRGGAAMSELSFVVPLPAGLPLLGGALLVTALLRRPRRRA